MKIVIAPDSFKEALPARQVCEAIARGVRRARPEAEIDLVPMADGGEGTVETLLAATNGRAMKSEIAGPWGEPVTAQWGLLDGEPITAVIEMAAASGLALVPKNRRDPTRTTTRGTGELILHALDAGAKKILIGIGGSATNDGGTGAAQAVGVRFLDKDGRPLEDPLSGGRLHEIASIDVSTRDPRIMTDLVQVACDVDNPLTGPRGAAAIYGPQKGASPGQVKQLDQGLAHLARLIERDLGAKVADIPGAGAAGGLGAGLLAFFQATLQPGIDLVIDAVDLRSRVQDADLVITGEGRLDAQSMMGKVVAGVGRTARSANVPVFALVGAVGDGADQTLALLRGYQCITPSGTPLEAALSRTAEFLERAAAALDYTPFTS